MAGFAPQNSWQQRICPGRRVILILLGLLVVVTLSIITFGFFGRKYGAALEWMEEDVKSINRTIVAELAALKQKEANNLKILLKVDQMVKNLSEEAKEVKSQFQDQVTKLQGTLQKLNCDLDDTKHNRTGPRACCPKGWRLLGHSCYWVSAAQKTWNEAREDCEGKNAHLVILASYVEVQFVFQLTKPRTAWIGLKYIGDAWKWVDGTTYTVRRIDWRPGKPNRFARFLDTAFCVTLYRDGLWSDDHCELRLNWVCEVQAKQ
ncbi:C-type lectin domain family 10 member A [Python bivittatus]|uniref:C-type lectin domain family 10 member A n=1 Tax=Python bivittatus TaxID=176946 RepID=A0A9F2RD05_PYTBI|nr:C-type lectin domain family 10 member A [Python bivittatus]